MHGHGHGSPLAALDTPKGAGAVAPVYRALFHFNNSDADECGVYGWSAKSQVGSYATSPAKLGSHSLKGAFNWTLDADPLADRNTVACGVAAFVRCGLAGAANKQKLHSTYGDSTHYSDLDVYFYNATTLRFRIANRTDLSESDTLVYDHPVASSVNTWFWVAIVIRGTDIDCYVDGVKVTTLSLTGTTAWDQSSAAPVINGNLTLSYLDELAYFKGAVPPAVPATEIVP